MARKYTEKIHAKRLLGMLKQKKPCRCCPSQRQYLANAGFVKGFQPSVTKKSPKHPCQVCRTFVGSVRKCPCYEFGEEQALKRTWEALEAKGYI